MNNLTSMPTFLLLGFSEVRELRIFHFFVFLPLYLMAVTGNLLIIIAIVVDHRLHTAMYFFLLNLAIVDLGSISVILPKVMAMSIMDNRFISSSGCTAQVFFYFFFASSDLLILTIMAHDRHIAICNPLEYERIVHRGTCLEMVAAGWIFSFCSAVLNTGGTFVNTFCSNTVGLFFCDIPHLLKLSCTRIYLVEVGLLVLSCGIALGFFVFIIITYLKIFAAVMRIPSVHGQKKALSTCIPHLTVVSMFIFTGVFAHVIPPSDTSSAIDVTFAMIYSIIPPILNPFIYSMRNSEIKAALWRLKVCASLSKHH